MIHAITATWAITEAKKREALQKNCPKCRDEQIASEEKTGTTIKCRECGKEIASKELIDERAEKNNQLSE